jgi:hypothetical protein
MALANAGALLNPLVRRIHHGGKFGVGENTLRQIGAD